MTKPKLLPIRIRICDISEHEGQQAFLIGIHHKNWPNNDSLGLYITAKSVVVESGDGEGIFCKYPGKKGYHRVRGNHG
jgi:hypothetical protein